MKVSSNPATLAGRAAGKIGPSFLSLRGEQRLRSRSRIPNFARYIYGRALRFLKSLIARIDVMNFPGSCCG